MPWRYLNKKQNTKEKSSRTNEKQDDGSENSNGCNKKVKLIEGVPTKWRKNGRKHRKNLDGFSLTLK